MVNLIEEYNFQYDDEGTLAEDAAMNIALAIEDLWKALIDANDSKPDEFRILKRYAHRLATKIGQMQHDGYL